MSRKLLKRRAEQNIARERIERLHTLSREVFHRDKGLATRYVDLAKKISMKSRVRLAREHKRYICKACGSLLLPGVNCRVRVRPERGTTVVVTCLDCGARKRYPAIKEKMKHRS